MRKVTLGAVVAASDTLAAPGGAAATIAIKGVELVRFLERVKDKYKLTAPKVVKAIEGAQKLVQWIARYPICFVAGTPVHTLEGLKNIEDIREGEAVLSRSEDDPIGPTQWRRVLKTITTHPSRLYKIRFVAREQNQSPERAPREFETITGTGEHPFFVVNRRKFIPAKDLTSGDILSLADGRTAVVVEIDMEDAAPGKTFTTYNLAIAEDHTYFVGRAGVWVHNQGAPCDHMISLFVAAKRLGRSDADALLQARRYLAKLDIGDIERARHLADFDKILAKGIRLSTLTEGEARALPAGRGLIFVEENLGKAKSAEMKAAREFQAGALNAETDVAPALRYNHPEGRDFVKFDGFELLDNGTVELIDTKMRLLEFDTRAGPVIPPKQLKQLQRQELAIAQNPGFRAFIEMPNETVADEMRRYLIDNNITNLRVRVR